MKPHDEDLIRHAQSLRGLARALVGPAHADDLVQDAVLAACTSRPDEPEAARSWLQSVLRHKAWKWRRGVRRREARERDVARGHDEPGTGPFDVAVHREAVAGLHAALLSLPEAYQSVLLQRYFEDRTPTEIAGRSGEPLATVKSRLRRALELLRERMHRRVGGDWRAGLVAAFGVGRSAGPAVAAGTLIMAMVTKVVAAVAAAVLVLWWLWPTANVGAPGEREPGSSAVAFAAEGRTHVPLGVVPSDTMREGARPATDSRGTGTTGQPWAGVTFFGRSVDHRGMPLVGVQVLGAMQDVGNGKEAARGRAVSGADGAFALRLPAAELHNHMLTFSLEGHCELQGAFWNKQPGERVDVGDLYMPTACAVRGVAVGADGVGAGGVWVRLQPTRNETGDLLVAGLGSAEARTAADGTFAIGTAVPPGDYVIWLGNRKTLDGRDPTFTIAPEQRSHDLEIRVGDAPPACRGVVVDEAGNGVSGVHVMLDEGRLVNTVTTDGDGRFEVLPDPNRVEHQVGRDYVVDASAEGYEGCKVAWHPDRADEPLRLVLQRRAKLRVRVVDGTTRAPVEAFALWRMSPVGMSNVPAVPEGVHVGGVVELWARPGDRLLFVEPADPAYEASRLVPVEIVAGQDAEVVIELSPPVRRRLVVRSEGRPIAAVTVELFDSAGVPATVDTEIWPMGKFNGGGRPIARLIQRGETDVDGARPLHGPVGQLGLRLSGGGIARQFVQPVRLDEAGDLVVSVARGGTLVGRLEPKAVAKRIWRFARERASSPFRREGVCLVDLDGRPLGAASEPMVPVAEDGTFRIEGIPAGSYGLAVVERGRYVAGRFTIAAGETIEQAFDLSSLVETEVALRVLLDGRPVTGKAVTGYGTHAPDALGRPFARRHSAETDDDGRVSLRSQAGELAIVVPWRDEQQRYNEFVGSVIVPAPHPDGRPAELVVDMRTGWLDLRLLAADGSPAEGATIDVRGTPSVEWREYAADAEGRVRIRVASGTYELRALPRRLGKRDARQAFLDEHGWQALENSWLPLDAVQVAAGAATGTPLPVLLPPDWTR